MILLIEGFTLNYIWHAVCMIVPKHCIRFFDIHSFKNKAIVPHPESAHHVGIYIGTLTHYLHHWSNPEVKLSDGLKGLRPQAWSPSSSEYQYHQHVCMFCTKTEVGQVKLIRFSFMGLTLIRAHFKGTSADYGFTFKQSHAEVWAN